MSPQVNQWREASVDPENRLERKQMSIRIRFLCLLLILGGLSACGKKGPLYLPPGMIPVLKPIPESTVEPAVEPAVTPATDASRTASPAATPTDKAQP